MIITEEKERDFMPIWEKILVLFVLTVSISSLYVVIFTSLGRKQDSTADTNFTESRSSNISIIVLRKEWGAKSPTGPLVTLKRLPVPYVIISHTSTFPCFTKTRCAKIICQIQTFHTESKGWHDIGYNFLIGGDGLIYEARGWDVEGAHTINYNHRSIGISFIGNFNIEEPTLAQISAAKMLLDYGVNQGKIDKDYELFGHRQCIKTESPGDYLYNIIKTWKHWSPEP